MPCLSAASAAAGWTRSEYAAEFSGDNTRTVIPLVLDKRRAYYADKTEGEHFPGQGPYAVTGGR
ncbi:hypothetical protein SMD20_11055 [Nonomuraea sp. LP-02]|uniref:hypothetical protein n=1 Tax=Nonomuraea sp. LP-02 TaxID=3097960 RepID=UPI002E2F9EE1|nr:hypothetical protein [Nonomuraea sp. LP-02]MED7924776.1 hypothetical protein [Nonomuraea sp. LP-02]